MNPRLITDADVLAGRVAPPIVLGPGVLLTPAGRDRAVSKGWTIVEADAVVGRGSSAAQASVPASAAGRVPASAAEAHRPAAGGAKTCGCGGRCAPTCACSRRAHDAAPAALPDGVHVVRVEGGRVVWSRPVGGETPARPGS